MANAPVGTRCFSEQAIDTGKTMSSKEIPFQYKAPLGWVITQHNIITNSNNRGNAQITETAQSGEASAVYSQVFSKGQELERMAESMKASGQYKGVGASGQASGYSEAMRALEQARNYVQLATTNTSFIRGVARAESYCKTSMFGKCVDRHGGWWNGKLVVVVEKFAQDPQTINRDILNAITEIEKIRQASVQQTPSTTGSPSNTVVELPPVPQINIPTIPSNSYPPQNTQYPYGGIGGPDLPDDIYQPQPPVTQPSPPQQSDNTGAIIGGIANIFGALIQAGINQQQQQAPANPQTQTPAVATPQIASNPNPLTPFLSRYGFTQTQCVAGKAWITGLIPNSPVCVEPTHNFPAGNYLYHHDTATFEPQHQVPQITQPQFY
jgi:hypothetical protein